jgi:hypothetical protein
LKILKASAQFAEAFIFKNELAGFSLLQMIQFKNGHPYRKKPNRANIYGTVCCFLKAAWVNRGYSFP